MTRPPDPQTKPQRAPKENAQPEGKRERGYEERDAPPAKVALGAAGFYAILLFGIAAAAVTITFVAPRMGLVAHAPAKPRFADASLPPLLVEPIAHRRRVEAEARGHLDPRRIRRAMAEVEARRAGDAP
jgi:hypothetical protein